MSVRCSEPLSSEFRTPTASRSATRPRVVTAWLADSKLGCHSPRSVRRLLVAHAKTCRYLRVAMAAAPAFGVATMSAVSHVRPMPMDRRVSWRGGRGSADSVHGLRKRIPVDRPDSLTQLLGRTDATRLRPIDGCCRRRGATDRCTALSCTPGRSARDRKNTDRDPLRNDRRCDTELQRRFAGQSLER